MLALITLLGCFEFPAPQVIATSPESQTSTVSVTEEEDGTLTITVDPWTLEFTSYDGNAAYATFGIRNDVSVPIEVYSVVTQPYDAADQLFFLNTRTLDLTGICMGTSAAGEPIMSDLCGLILEPHQLVPAFVVFEPGWSGEAMASAWHEGAIKLIVIPSDGTLSVGTDEMIDDDELMQATPSYVGLTGNIVNTGGQYVPSTELPEHDTGI